MSATEIIYDGDTTYNLHTMVTSSIQNDNIMTISSLPLVYYAISIPAGLLVMFLSLTVLLLCVYICKQHRKKLFAYPIEEESKPETVEQQEMDIHVSKNVVYEAVRNSYAHNVVLKDNVAYSSAADTIYTTSNYEYIV
jgi:hypothetical protein